MLNHSDIMSTVDMIDHQHLDIRTITMGISLLDCADPDPAACARKIHDKICRQAEHLVATGCQIERELGIPIVNKRISVTPMALVAGASETGSYVPFAVAMDNAAKSTGVNFIGGFSALVQKGMTEADRKLIASIPEALAVTDYVCSSINLGSTRGDDPEHVRENYRRFFAAVGADLSTVAMTNQVHSDVVRPVTTADIKTGLLDPEPYEADGLVTDIPGVALVIFSADCLPVLLYDPVRRVIAAVHAGWRGTASGIVERAVEKMAFYGCRPEDILAAIGPGIGPCCFETHDDVPSAMVQRLGEDILSHCVPLAHGKFSVDLKGIIHWQLTQAGLADGHVDTLSLCTAGHPELYWAHRKMGDQRGNHAAMLQLLP